MAISSCPRCARFKWQSANAMDKLNGKGRTEVCVCLRVSYMILGPVSPWVCPSSQYSKQKADGEEEDSVARVLGPVVMMIVANWCQFLVAQNVAQNAFSHSQSLLFVCLFSRHSIETPEILSEQTVETRQD